VGLSCDLPRRTNAKLGIRLVEGVFAVEEVQERGAQTETLDPTLACTTPTRAVLGLLAKYIDDRTICAHSSGFRDIRLPQQVSK
jgi:hypothetical protein